ncbi:helix-turn-helix domain-containing protein [Arthrobacter sp. 260]|nr:helix-turn-helix domain-containing protein [Arthrobacter sp. 260]
MAHDRCVDIPSPGSFKLHSEGPTAETVRLRATLEIANALLDAVSSQDPVHALTSRIGMICRGAATIYDYEGKIVESVGGAPTQLIWNEVEGSNQPELVLEIGRWHVMTRRVALRAGIHVIAIASRSLDTLSEIGGVLLDTSERFLGAVHGIQYGVTLRDRRDNEQLIASLHDGIIPSREHRFWIRVAQFHFTAYSPLRAAELRPLSGSAGANNDVTRLASRARSNDIPLLIMLRRAELESPAVISAILPATKQATRWLDLTASEYLIGVSAPFSALVQVPESVREAETALGIAETWAAVAQRPELIGPVRIDEIDLSTWLLSHVNPVQLQARITATLAPVNTEPLRETLITYLANNQNVARTAEALYIHQNTVRYRLGRIEEAIGLPLDFAPALANLVLALYPELGPSTSGSNVISTP